MTALIKCTDDWFRALEYSQEVCATFFDFRKAFNSVPHQILWQKLASLNLDDYLLAWTHDYLYKRSQSVVVDGAELGAVPILSVLDLLLFLI